MIESFIVLTVTREDVANTFRDEKGKEKALALTDWQMQHITNRLENALMEFYWETLGDIALEEV